MPMLSDAFPSKYLKADVDVPEDGSIVVTIKDVVTEEVGTDKEEKLIVYFNELDKGLVLNKTNGTTIGGFYGNDTDAWAGGLIGLFSADVDYQGKMMRGIRVKSKKPTGKPSAPRPPVQAATTNNNADEDSDIPF